MPPGQEILRHAGPRFLCYGNIVTGDAFLLRKDEPNLSWRRRSGVLRDSSALSLYQAFHEYTFTADKGRGRKRYRPGLLGLYWREVFGLGLRPRWRPEPRVLAGRPNPYWKLHYETKGEPPVEVRVALAAIASDRILAPCHEVG